MMKGCLWILLLYLVFISVLIIALAILFEYGGLAFIAFALIASCAVGMAANYILEKRDRDEL
jgi:putative flippase GtrA